MVKSITPPDETISPLHKSMGIVTAIRRRQLQDCRAIKNGKDVNLEHAYRLSYLKRGWEGIMRRNLAKLNRDYRRVMATGTKSRIVIRFK